MSGVKEVEAGAVIGWGLGALGEESRTEWRGRDPGWGWGQAAVPGGPAARP